ncbi:TIGR01906 family membrane protein [Candidatus Woesearchaeota archaeon]|nr:TIGR01906 family membrane protein [Candidatus Woesearchaeota archaeon]
MKNKLILISTGILIFVMVLLIPVFIYTNSFERYSFDIKFYEKEFEKYNITEDNSILITKNLLVYLKGEERIINSNNFNTKEKYHLTEVKEVIKNTLEIKRSSAYILILVFFLLFLLCWNENLFLKKLSYGVFGGGVITTIIFLLGLLLLLDFTGFFFKFHTIFFDSNTWLLNPESDLLIRLFPEGFFYDISGKIFLTSFLHGLTMIAASLPMMLLYSKKQKK